MGIVEIITVILILFKLVGAISLTWLQVLTPEMIAILAYIIVFIVSALFNKMD